MNNIPVIQNTHKQLQRLAAQRELYTSAKRFHVFQVITTVIVPTLLAVLSLFVNSISALAALYGIISFICDIAFIDPEISKRKHKATKIQEMFDCETLQLTKSPLKIVDDVIVEDVLSQYNAHIKIQGNLEKIRDWYSPSVGQLPLSTARILCQRTNCWWDSQLRRKYSSFLKYCAVSVFLIITVTCLSINLTMVNFVLIRSALIPFFQFCIKQSNDNTKAACRLDQLVTFSLKLWENALDGKPESCLLEDSRKLRDEQYEHRRTSPLILDYYYNVFRDKDEVLMNVSAEHLIQEWYSSVS